MAQNRFSTYPCRVVHGGGTLNLTQLVGQSAEAERALSEVIPAGAVDRGAVIVSHQTPMIRITVDDLNTLLGTVSLFTGLKITGNSYFWAQKRDIGGLFAAGGAHFETVVATGFMCVDEITASQDDEKGAVASCLVFPYSSDGITHPFATSVGASLAAAPVPTFVSQYYLGRVYYGTDELEGVQSVRIKSGIGGFSLKRASGDVVPRKGSILTRVPEVEITFDDLDRFVTFGPNSWNGATIGADLKIYLLRGSPGGTRLALGGAGNNHIKITYSAGYRAFLRHGGQGNADHDCVMQVLPTTLPTISLASDVP